MRFSVHYLALSNNDTQRTGVSSASKNGEGIGCPQSSL